MLYFAYGSNLHLGQMARRCPDAEPLGSIILPDTQLVFRGVADVIRQDGAQCPGGIWRITKRCEAALDRYEGYDPDHPERGMYRKELVQVDGLPDGETEIMLYAMNSTGIYPPSDGYFQTIVQGYKDFGLDRAALKIALDHSYEAKHPSHIERKRMRRMGRPALAARPVIKPRAPAPEPAKRTDKAAKKAAKKGGKGQMMDGGKHRRAVDALHDPWANVSGDQRRRKVMNLSEWLRDRKNSGTRH
jgi:Gamma-glutamyl cyclotransferase, AIG2-like